MPPPSPLKSLDGIQLTCQKSGDMAVGQVSFHNDKKVKRGKFIPPSCSYHLISSHLRSAFNEAREEMLIPVHVQTRDNAIVNRLNKTKVEKEVDHESDRQERLRLEGRKKKVEVLERVCPSIFPSSSYPTTQFLPLILTTSSRPASHIDTLKRRIERVEES